MSRRTTRGGERRRRVRCEKRVSVVPNLHRNRGLLLGVFFVSVPLITILAESAGLLHQSFLLGNISACDVDVLDGVHLIREVRKKCVSFPLQPHLGYNGDSCSCLHLVELLVEQHFLCGTWGHGNDDPR